MNEPIKKNRLEVRMGRSLARDEKTAVSEFRQAVQQPGMEAVIFFSSSRYNLDILGRVLAKSFDCPLIGCTTAGEISTFGYQERGIVGASLSSGELKIHRYAISPLSGFSLAEGEKLASDLRANLSLAQGFDKQKAFGFLLIDGLSMLEESVTASLYASFDGIPIIGGSSGDDLEFRRTCVYDNGEFTSDAAIFSVFETTLPFMTFKTQHFQPTDTKIVITGADPARRVITEINGGVAAIEYARVIGAEPGRLNPEIFSANPLLLRIGGEWHVRAIQKLNADYSLSIFSAIEEGLVLTIGKGVDILSNFADQIALVEAGIPCNRLLILCDCILRRLELSSRGIIGEADDVLKGSNVIGFSTYGEQCNAVHVNQTLTGIAIGG